MNNRRLYSISLGHLSVDILTSSVVIILTFLSKTTWTDLPTSMIGFGVMIVTFSSALTQPLFGLLADRFRARWLGAVGLLWVMIFYTAASFASTYVLLITLLTIGAMGSALFHPVGVVTAGTAGGRRATTATSIFFLFGQSGLALGPFISGILLARMGMAGLPLIVLAMTPVVILMVINLRGRVVEPSHSTSGATVDAATVTVGALVIISFVMVIALRAATIQSYMTLLPKYLADLGHTSAAYGPMVAVFVFGGALGTFFGGYLGDRFDRKVLIVGSLLLSVPFTIGVLHLEGWLFLAITALSGLLLSIPHSIILILAQELFPARKALMGGSVLGFMFASGAAATWVAALIADQIGLGVVLTVLALLPLPAALGAIFLPTSPKIGQLQPESISLAAD